MVDLSKFTKKDLGKLFDYSVLPKNTREKDIRDGCKKAIEYHCASFYSSSPFWTPIIVEELEGSDVLVATGINFPFGSGTPEVKAFEAEEAYRLGNRALDMVINVGALKDKRYAIIEKELRLFKQASQDALTKVILEVCFLSDEEIEIGSKLIAEAGIDYVKTSSGQFEGPSMEQFLIMKKAVEGANVKLKVSGVKFPRPQNAFTFLLAGADLIGTRAAPEIIDAVDQLRELGLVPKYKG